MYFLTYCDAATGIVVDGRGRWQTSGTPCSETFAHLSDAEAFCREYVKSHPKIECALNDELGEWVMVVGVAYETGEVEVRRQK